MVRLIFKLSRFGVVGAAATVAYALAAALFVEVLSWPPIIASVAGFFSALPISYFGHRNWTFRSTGRHNAEMVRFIITATVSFAFVVGSMTLAVDVLNLHYLVGVFAACVLVPIGTFVAMNLLVFRNQRDHEPVDAAPQSDDLVQVED